MKVSVIIPCFNNADFVGQAISSALDQSHKNIEVIVVNDGSTDKSAEVISAFGDKIIYLEQENQGACVARNAGLAVATGDWIKFLDGDDWLDLDCLANQLSAVRNPDAVQFGYPEIVDERGELQPEIGHLNEMTMDAGSNATLSTFLQHPILISITLYPRDIIVSAGGFNATVKRGQEHEMHVRMYLSGVDFYFIPIKCFYYRQHESPHRISSVQRGNSYFFDFAKFEGMVKYAEEGPRSAEFADNRLDLGKSAWRTARRLVRLGQAKSARKFFRFAVQLGGQEVIHGNDLYKKLNRFMNPVFLERALMLAKRILGRRSYD